MQKERYLHVNNVIVEANVGYEGRKNSNSEEQEQEKEKRNLYIIKVNISLKRFQKLVYLTWLAGFKIIFTLMGLLISVR